jgi:predicted Zn-dependent protease
MLALAPGDLPASDDPDGFVRAVADAEALRGAAGWSPAYHAAVQRWPEHRLARLGLANALRAEGRMEESVAELEILAARDPTDSIALNNLADGLLRLGCRDQALEVIDRASRSSRDGGRIRAAIEATRREIEASPEGDGGACVRAPAEERR